VCGVTCFIVYRVDELLSITRKSFSSLLYCTLFAFFLIELLLAIDDHKSKIYFSTVDESSLSKRQKRHHFVELLGLAYLSFQIIVSLLWNSCYFYKLFNATFHYFSVPIFNLPSNLFKVDDGPPFFGDGSHLDVDPELCSPLELVSSLLNDDLEL
jgi:hypothetical protein